MDTFFEQLVKIRMSPARITAVVVTFLMGACVSAFVFVLGFTMNFLPIAFLVVCLIMYIAWRSASQFFIEYEYILTNGEVDIDKILNKRKRDRVLTFNCSEIESVKRYVKDEHVPENVKLKVFACTPDENTYSMIIRSERRGLVYLVFSPDERMTEGMKKFMKREIAFDAFKQ